MKNNYRIHFNDRVHPIKTGRKPSPELYKINEFEPKQLNTTKPYLLALQIQNNINKGRGIYFSISGADVFIDYKSNKDEILINCVDAYDVQNVIDYLKSIYGEALIIEKNIDNQIIITINPENAKKLSESLNNNERDGYLFDKLFEVANDVRSHMVHTYGEDFLHGKCIEASDMIVDLLKQKDVDAKAVEGWVTYDNPEGCTDRDYDEHTWVEVKSLEDTFILDVTATQFNHFMDEDYPPIIIAGELPYGFSYEEPKNSLLDEQLNEAKKRKKKKSQTQNTPVFKDINDLLRWTKKRQKGLPCFGGWLNPNAGNVEYNNDFFNHVTGADNGDFGSLSGSGNELGAPAGGIGDGADASMGGGMGESYNTNKSKEHFRNIFVLEEDIPIVHKFIEDYKDSLNDNLPLVVASAIARLDTIDQFEYLLHMLYEANVQIPSRKEVSNFLADAKWDLDSPWIKRYLNLL